MLEKIIVGGKGRGKTHDITRYAWWNNCNIIVASNNDKNVIKEMIDKQGNYGSWEEWKDRIYTVHDLCMGKHRGKEKKGFVIDDLERVLFQLLDDKVIAISINKK